jgi:alpha-galactosidase
MSTRLDDTMDPAVKRILQNKEVIAINQDYAGRVGVPIQSPLSKAGTVWGKPLSVEATAPPPGYVCCGAAALLLGAGNQPNVTVYFQDLGFGPNTMALVRDLVAGTDLGHFVGSFQATNMSDGDSMLIKVTPKK